MPNKANIESPITLISYGRSGTSLISAILEAGGVEYVGETAQLVFWSWLATEDSIGVIRSIANDGDYSRMPPVAVQNAFLCLFPGDAPRWCHKPIGVPEAFFVLKKRGIDVESWYWNALTKSFPSSSFLTVLRNPIDVAVSSHIYFGYPIHDIVKGLGAQADIIACKASRAEYAVDFRGLAETPRAEIASLCNFLKLDFNEKMLAACEQRHAPRDAGPGSRQGSAKDVSEIRKQVMQDVNLADTLHRIDRMWKKFNRDLEKVLTLKRDTSS